MVEDKTTEKIIGLCYSVFNELGPGFPEKVYQNALEKLFEEEIIRFQSERPFDVLFKGERVGLFKVDFLVDDSVILEIKSITGKLPKVFEAQVISYLKAAGIKAGLLVNFGDTSCTVRRINDLRN